MQGCKDPALYARLYRPWTICRVFRPCILRKGVQARHYSQVCAGPARYVGLYRTGTALRAMPALHYTQGFIGHVLYAGLCRPCGRIRRDLKVLHYTQGCTGRAVYVGLCRPCTVAGIFRSCSICRAVQALHYMRSFVGPTLYTQGCAGPTL